MSVRPPPPLPSRDRGGNNAATLTALIMLVGCAAALLFLISLVMPMFLGILIIGMIFVPMTLVHYLVWGRLMEQQQAPEDTTTPDAP